MLSLPQVTLICVDTDHSEAGCVSILKSLSLVKFADTLLFLSNREHLELHGRNKEDIQFHRIESFKSSAEYSRFVIKDIYRYINTDFVLMTHWDGWIVNPDMWSDEFLEYDYIGAPWPWEAKNNVGNGGFSLRSKRLLAILHENELQNMHPEDDCICKHYRESLEDVGIKFAPPEVASRFAVECWWDGHPTFGFHGAFNFPHYLPKNELGPLLDMLPQETLKSRAMDLAVQAYQQLAQYGQAEEILRRRK